MANQLKVREKQLEQTQAQLVTLRNENVDLQRRAQDVKLEAQQSVSHFDSLKAEFSKRLAAEEKKTYQLRKVRRRHCYNNNHYLRIKILNLM